jgi:hypothetical protein
MSGVRTGSLCLLALWMACHSQQLSLAKTDVHAHGTQIAGKRGIAPLSWRYRGEIDQVINSTPAAPSLTVQSETISPCSIEVPSAAGGMRESVHKCIIPLLL